MRNDAQARLIDALRSSPPGSRSFLRTPLALRSLEPADAAAILDSRTTVRDFAARSVSLRDVRAVLAAGLPVVDLACLLYARHVDGLSTGWYLVTNDGRVTVAKAFESMAPPQTHYGDAPVVVVLGISDLVSVAEHRGVYGYLELFVEAGLQAQTMHFAALESGLVGGIFYSTSAVDLSHVGSSFSGSVGVCIGHPRD